MWKYSGKFLKLIFCHSFITICLQVDMQAVPDWYRTLHTAVGFIQTSKANHGKLLLSQLSLVLTHCKFQRQTNGQKNKIKHRQDSKSKVPLRIAVPVWQEVSPLGPQPQYAWNCPISKDNKLFSSDIGWWNTLPPDSRSCIHIASIFYHFTQMTAWIPRTTSM